MAGSHHLFSIQTLSGVHGCLGGLHRPAAATVPPGMGYTSGLARSVGRKCLLGALVRSRFKHKVVYLLRNKERGSHLQSRAERPGKRRLPSGSSAVTRSLHRDLTEPTHGVYSVYSTSCWTVPVVGKGSGETEKDLEERCETPDWGPGDLALACAELEAFDLFYLIQGKQWGAQAAVSLQTVGN